MKFRNIYLPMLFIWCMDLLSTVIGLNAGLTEGNIKAGFFMSMGLIGWIYWFLIGATVIFLYALLTNYTYKTLFKNWKSFIGMWIFITIEFFVVLRNLFLVFVL